MRKNGSKLISVKQYRLGDLCMFALIAAIAELVCYFARYWFSDAAFYTLNLMLPVITLVIVRWGWWGLILAALDGVLYSAIRGVEWQMYVIIIVSNLALSAQLLLTKTVKGGFKNHWYFAALVVLTGWVAQNLVRALLFAAFYGDIASAFATMFGFSDCGLLALVMGEIIIIVCRKFDGLFEDQKSYLLRLKKEREEQIRRDAFGDEPVTMDEESLSILNKKDDELYK